MTTMLVSLCHTLLESSKMENQHIAWHDFMEVVAVSTDEMFETHKSENQVTRRSVLGSAMSVIGAGVALETSAAAAQQQPPAPRPGAPVVPPTPAEAELLKISRDKWALMSEKKADELAKLFHDKAIFVHMGGSMTREMELGVIRSGGIHYKTFDIKRASASIIDATGIVLTTMTLIAVVGGNEVTNPFVVTETYVRQAGAWKLAALAFTRTLG
ncbi:MAG: hypothetical protein RJA02_1622 [Armatimonadota bacterium]